MYRTVALVMIVSNIIAIIMVSIHKMIMIITIIIMIKTKQKSEGITIPWWNQLDRSGSCQGPGPSPL